MKLIYNILKSISKVATSFFFIIAFIGTVNSQDIFSLELQFSELKPEVASSILIAVYISKETFLSDKPFKTFTVRTEGLTSFSHKIALPKGKYALAFFQDLNKDNILNKNFIGYPTEPFTFSNNAPANFGPPKYDDALFNLDKNEVMPIEF